MAVRLQLQSKLRRRDQVSAFSLNTSTSHGLKWGRVATVRFHQEGSDEFGAVVGMSPLGAEHERTPVNLPQAANAMASTTTNRAITKVMDHQSTCSRFLSSGPKLPCIGVHHLPVPYPPALMWFHVVRRISRAAQGAADSPFCSICCIDPPSQKITRLICR